MMQVKVIREYFDKDLGKYKKPNDIFEVTKDRGQVLIKNKVAKEEKKASTSK